MTCLRSLPENYVVIEKYDDRLIVGITDFLEMFCDSIACFFYGGEFYYRGPLVAVPDGMAGRFCSCREYRK